jgi:hypothetical protein
MTQQLRRILTGHNENGESIIEIDAGPAQEIGANGSSLHEIWLTDSLPADNTTFTGKIAQASPTLCPPAGASKVRWFTVPVENPEASAEARGLKPGDVIVQRGTNHAWVNTGSEPALLVAVLADAEPV